MVICGKLKKEQGALSSPEIPCDDCFFVWPIAVWKDFVKNLLATFAPELT